MATVNYIREKTQSRAAMKRVIDYVLQDKKTLIVDNERKYKLVSGKDCSPETVFNEFMATKNQYCKAKGMFFYQYTQSFGINENVSPQTVHEVGRKLAEYFKDHEVLIATHIDADHLHNHFIINSVSHETGKKLQEGPDSLYKLRKLSDSICHEYGLSVLKPYEKNQEKGIGTREYRAALKGDSWKFKLINTIDICMKKSKDKKEFIGNMEKYGYKTNWTDNRKYITYTTSDGKKCRDNKLHDKKYLKIEMENHYESFRKLEGIEPTRGNTGNGKYLNETLSADSVRSTSGAMERLDRISYAPESNSGANGRTFDNFTNMEGFRRVTNPHIEKTGTDSQGQADGTLQQGGSSSILQPQFYHSGSKQRFRKKFTGYEEGIRAHINTAPNPVTGEGFESSTHLHKVGSSRSGNSNSHMDNLNNNILNKPKQIQEVQQEDLEDDMDLEMEM
ncbi:relaxase/mobilization nuclease domain-containing protein [Tyzzerella sp. OttesenSCG-928-J15]|nr:relaxase/mobilization nuclease domain-containing protein [Tyzzerella sp. OttesenSCG-928-J15]